MNEGGDAPETGQPAARGRRWPLITTLVAAAAVALGVYLIGAAGMGAAVSYTLLIILPAILSALVAWVGSIRRDWPASTFALVPVWLTLSAAVIGAALLREGVICILMLMPLWLIFGMLGVWPVYLHRRAQRRVDSNIFRANALLLLPLLTLFVEQHIDPPRETYIVAREIIVDASPEAVWEQLLAIPAIGPDEGRWTVSQSLIRLPRPTAALLSGRGVGAVRDARWQDGIRFEEIVTRWQPGQELAWRFAFPDPSIYRRTDRHINPRSRQLSIDTGGYQLTPLADGRTNIHLWTRYRVATPVNAYAALWGELILGDIQTNVLAIVAHRLTGESR